MQRARDDHPGPRRPKRRRAWWAVVATVFVLSAAGCGRSGYDYVENRDEGLFVKVRDDWQIEELTPYQLEKANLGCCWGSYLFAPERTMSPVASEDPTVSDLPVGLVQVITLDAVERDNANLTFLRRLTLSGQYDPADIAGMSEEQRSEVPPALADIDIVSYDEMNGDEDTFGSDLMIRIGKENPTARIVRQLAFLAPDFTRVYRLQIECSYECYSVNQDEIDAIFDSWTLQKTGGS